MMKSQNQAQWVRKWAKYAICGCTVIGLLSPTSFAQADTTVQQSTNKLPIMVAPTAKSIKLSINGTELKTAVKPYLENNVSYVPLQTILNTLEYKYRVKGNQITITVANRVSVLTLNSQTMLVNGKKTSLKGKVKKVGNTFVVPGDAISKVIGKGTTGYYAGQNIISVRVPINITGSQKMKEKYSPSYQVERVSFDIPADWAQYIRINGPQASEYSDQEHMVTIDWVENGITTFLGAIIIRDEYDRTTKQWEKWFEVDSLEIRLLKENGVMYSYIPAGDPTEELLKPENVSLYDKLTKIINDELVNVIQTMNVTYK